jgi:hypothetical protein
MEKQSDDDRVVSRRWYVRTAGATAIAGLAGCPADGNGTDTTPGDTPTGTETRTPTETASATPTQTPDGTAPLYEQASRIDAADIGSEGLFGWSIAVSDDGSTAVVSSVTNADEPDDNASAVYVLSQSGGSWERQATLVRGEGSDSLVGVSVAISGDGTTAFVSVFEDLSGESPEIIPFKINVFEESGGSWSQQATLVPEDFGWFGSALAASADGTTVLVSNELGFDDPDGERVEVSVFQQSGGSWSQQATLDPDDGVLKDSVVSVAISSDGTSAVVGVPVDSRVSAAEEGIAYVFAESSGAWRQQATLTGDEALDPAFGISVDISGDGNTVLVSAPDPTGPMLANATAYVFTQSDDVWSQAATLVPDEDSTGGFGWRVGLSDEGNTAIVLAPAGAEGGSAAVFSQLDDAWERSDTLVPDTRTEDQVFGYSTAIAGDGNTVLISALIQSEDERSQTGAVLYVYRRTRPLPPSPPPTGGDNL